MAAFFAPGKYLMPDQDEPSKKTEIKARFLLGEKPPPDMKPDALRVAVDADKEPYAPESRPLKIVDGGSPVAELLS